MSKHTPGPWVWGAANQGPKDEDGFETWGPIDIATFKSPGFCGNPELAGKDGARVISAGGGEYWPVYQDGDRGVADARLIAAAPDLLELLDRAYEALMETDTGGGGPHSLTYQIRQLLRKVERG